MYRYLLLLAFLTAMSTYCKAQKAADPDSIFQLIKQFSETADTLTINKPFPYNTTYIDSIKNELNNYSPASTQDTQYKKDALFFIDTLQKTPTNRLWKENVRKCFYAVEASMEELQNTCVLKMADSINQMINPYLADYRNFDSTKYNVFKNASIPNLAPVKNLRCQSEIDGVIKSKNDLVKTMMEIDSSNAAKFQTWQDDMSDAISAYEDSRENLQSSVEFKRLQFIQEIIIRNNEVARNIEYGEWDIYNACNKSVLQTLQSISGTTYKNELDEWKKNVEYFFFIFGKIDSSSNYKLSNYWKQKVNEAYNACNASNTKLRNAMIVASLNNLNTKAVRGNYKTGLISKRVAWIEEYLLGLKNGSTNITITYTPAKEGSIPPKQTDTIRYKRHPLLGFMGKGLMAVGVNLQVGSKTAKLPAYISGSFIFPYNNPYTGSLIIDPNIPDGPIYDNSSTAFGAMITGGFRYKSFIIEAGPCYIDKGAENLSWVAQTFMTAQKWIWGITYSPTFSLGIQVGYYF